MLVGNKSDLENLREVKTDDAASYAEKRNMAYIEASALEATNVDVAFQRVIGEIYQLYLNSRKDKKGEEKDIQEGKDIVITKPTSTTKDKKKNSGGACC